MPHRPARLWVFNPGHEEALLAPPTGRYTPSREVRQMRHELAPLLTLLASPSDIIYVPASADGSIAASLLRGDGQPATPQELPAQLEVCLWGLEPHSLAEIQRSSLFQQTELELPPITPTFLQLSHRRASSDLLTFLIEQGEYPRDLLPQWVEAEEDREKTQEQLRKAIHEVSQRPLGDPTQLLIKRPYSSSGRGVLPLPLPLQPKHLDALAGNCLRVGSVSIEPFLRVRDNWAIEYYRDQTGEVHFYALSHFETLASGRAYAGNLLASPESLWEELSGRVGEGRLTHLIQLHTTWLKDALQASCYHGYIGIDLFLYEEQDQLLLHPCVEINLRTTMGVLAHKAYERYFSAGEQGRFTIAYQRERTPSFIATVEHHGVEIMLN